MESGSRPDDSKSVAAQPELAKAVADAHNGFFCDLTAIHHGTMELLHEAHRKYAHACAGAQTPAHVQAMNEEYARAVQAAGAGGELTRKLVAAFEKYRTAAALALAGTTDPASLALLSQSMYVVAMQWAHLDPPRCTI